MGRTHSTSSNIDTNIHTGRSGDRAGRHRRRRRAAAVVGAAAFVLAACSGADDSDTSATEDQTANSTPPAAEMEAGGEDTADVATPETGGVASAGLPINDFGRDIITSVGLTISTPDVGQTIDDIRPIVTNNGGAIFSSDVTIGDERDDGSVPGGGQIVVRVPPQDLDRLVTDLDGVATVSRVSQDSEDVTEQLVDLDIRIRQAETGIERIEELLGAATELGDVFAIETELTNRQVALERLRAAQRNTEDLVALATLTIDIEYRTPEQLAVAEEPGDGIGDAFADGWGAFVGAVFAVGYVLAISAPFLLTLVVVVALAWMVGKRLNRRGAENSERRRQSADRAGPPTPFVADKTAAASPPPPEASQRIVAQDTAPDLSGTATLTADDDDANPAE
jgi:hypothetical protein